jgi:hypothetical protein
MNARKKVGPGRVLWHCFLIVVTGGLWGFYLIVRALLKH